MARPQPAPSMDSLVGMDAKMAALAKLEMLQEEVDAVNARRKSNRVLRRAIKTWRRGDITKAGQLALEATVDAGEAFERARDRVVGQLELGGDGDRGQRVAHVVLTRQIELDRKLGHLHAVAALAGELHLAAGQRARPPRGRFRP